MKVLVAHNRYRSALPSGENAVVEDDIKVLRAAGVDVVPLIEDSDEIPGLGLGGKLGVASGPVFNPAGVARMRRMLAVHRPDLVHLHNVFPLLSPWVVRASHEAGVPVVQTVHNFRQDCVAGSYFRDGQVCTDCTGLAIAMPAIVHGCYRTSRLQTIPMVIGRSAHRSTWLSVERYFVLTEYHAKFIKSMGVPADRIVIRPTSVKDPGEASPPGRDVLYVGRLDDAKGVELLLDAWAAAPSNGRRLVVAGDGPLRDRVAARAATANSISFVGRLDEKAVSASMKSAGVLALPSVCLEGLPRVAIEAMSHGRAIMAVDQGGLAAVIGSEAGWLLPPEPTVWAETLGRLDDVELRRRGAGARASFDAHYERTITTGQLLRTYSELIAP